MPEYSTGKIFSKHSKVGAGTVIHSDIGSNEQPCNNVEIGDNVYIGSGCKIYSPDIVIKDYTKLHRNSLLYGRNPIKIGYNCWFGEGIIIDCEGSTHIANNVGVGAHSQLWSHIRHGDLMIGCRYTSFGRLTILDDAWLVGHCITSPVTIGACSLALVGSVITKNMEPNHIYGGSPAKDLTDKLGPPFVFTAIDQRYDYLKNKLDEFMAYPITLELFGELKVVTVWEPEVENVTQFNVTTREYTKRGSSMEVAFMQKLLPEAKFVPRQAV